MQIWNRILTILFWGDNSIKIPPQAIERESPRIVECLNQTIIVVYPAVYIWHKHLWQNKTHPTREWLVQSGDIADFVPSKQHSHHSSIMPKFYSYLKKKHRQSLKTKTQNPYCRISKRLQKK